MSNALVDIQAKLKQELANVGATVQAPGGRNISTRGKVFTLPDGRSSTDPMQVVILDHRNFNAYYTAAYNPNDIQPPRCFAIGKELELEPHSKATEPQHENCAGCAHNKFGSAPNGGKGKACRNMVRLAVAPLSMKADDEPFILKVSPTGLRSWSSLVNNLQVNGMLPIQVVTEIAFDANAAYPTLTFKALQAHEALETMWTLREKAQGLLDSIPTGNE